MTPTLVRRAVPHRRVQAYSILQIGQHVLFLNETATAIWDLVDGKTSDTDLIKKLAQRYPGVALEQLAEDAAGVIRKLIGARALAYTDGHTEPVSTQGKAIAASGLATSKSPFSICLTPKLDTEKSTT
ncbi:MAG TPA: PqqD family protein, partial [Acidobacteriaceae bacterium]|nr:PqqD family protein [Acidobacteriaceae bacterium]